MGFRRSTLIKGYGLWGILAYPPKSSPNHQNGVPEMNLTEFALLGFFNNAQKGIKTDGSQNRKFLGQSELAIWCTSKFGTNLGGALAHKRVSKLMVFKIASSGDFQNSQLNSGESNRPLTPILFEKYRDTHAISIAILCKSMPSSWQRAEFIHHQFVSRYGSHYCRDTFTEVLGSGVAGTLLIFFLLMVIEQDQKGYP